MQTSEKDGLVDWRNHASADFLFSYYAIRESGVPNGLAEVQVAYSIKVQIFVKYFLIEILEIQKVCANSNKNINWP